MKNIDISRYKQSTFKMVLPQGDVYYETQPIRVNGLLVKGENKINDMTHAEFEKIYRFIDAHHAQLLPTAHRNTLVPTITQMMELII